ncbi:MAG: AtpZ/AtpI family protein [Deltaproteobacteria bacterium]|nr:AtpZ/AtpI family protein [Deltaproteobacteria bacterium]
MPGEQEPSQEKWAGEVGRKLERKLAHRREGERSVWFGLGMFGLVGWSVAIPALLGVALGIWLDAKFESRRSWTLLLLGVGIVVGCLNAWWWVQKENKEK